jgi:hypothetical protein
MQRADACLVQWLPVLGGHQHAAHQVARAQQQVDQAGIDVTFAGTHFVEQRLRGVREPRHLGEAEGRAATLDGMGDAENRVDEFLGDTRGQLEQRGLHGVQRLEAFFVEGIVELREIECHAAPATEYGVAEPGLSSSAPTPSVRMASSSAGERPVHA